MSNFLSLQTPLNHPSYDGHFPGKPVLPGVLLLELVADAIALGHPCAIRSVKFHRALAPGETVGLSWTVHGRIVSFRCEHGSELVAEGKFEPGSP